MKKQKQGCKITMFSTDNMNVLNAYTYLLEIGGSCLVLSIWESARSVLLVSTARESTSWWASSPLSTLQSLARWLRRLMWSVLLLLLRRFSLLLDVISRSPRDLTVLLLRLLLLLVTMSLTRSFCGWLVTSRLSVVLTKQFMSLLREQVVLMFVRRNITRVNKVLGVESYWLLVAVIQIHRGDCFLSNTQSTLHKAPCFCKYNTRSAIISDSSNWPSLNVKK